QMGTREARLAELGSGDDRRADALEGLDSLELAGRDELAGVTAGDAPAQDVEYVVATNAHAVADDAVPGRGLTGGQRREGGGGRRRRHGGDRSPNHRTERRRQVRSGTQLFPAEAIECEEHDLTGVHCGPREPLGCTRTSFEQGA